MFTYKKYIFSSDIFFIRKNMLNTEKIFSQNSFISPPPIINSRSTWTAPYGHLFFNYERLAGLRLSLDQKWGAGTREENESRNMNARSESFCIMMSEEKQIKFH